MMPGVLHRYIARRFLGMLIILLLAGCFITFMADYVEVLRRFTDEDDYTNLLGLMLAAMHVPTLLEGRAPVVISPADPADVMVPVDKGAWHGPQPVPRFLMKVLPIEGTEWEGESPPSDELMTAESGFPQITLLCATRPAGWPA